jgi:hypothetical protein
MTFFESYKIEGVQYLCLMMPPIFGTCLAIYSEIPTSDSIRRMMAPLSSCKGGVVPRREWLGGRIVSFVATLPVAESEGTIDKVTDESRADFNSSVLSSTFNRFEGGASVVLSKDSWPRELDEVESIWRRTAVPESQCLQNRIRDQSMAAYLNTYADRAKKQINPAARDLLEAVERKQSNLCVSVDVTSSKDFLSIIDAVGPYVSLIKASIC